MLDRFTARVTFGVRLDVFAVEVVTVAGVQCAVAQFGAGDRQAAEATVRRLLLFHPDLEAVRQLAATPR